MSNETGGAAFPTNTTNESNTGACYADSGMTLRDYFAAKALPMAAKHMVAPSAKLNIGEYADLLAKLSYVMADAMIAERAK